MLQKEWDKMFETRVWGKYPSEELVRFVCRNKLSGDALELGSGVGANTWFLLKQGFNVYCIEGSETAIKQAWSNIEDMLPTIDKSRIIMECADFTMATTTPAGFDLVVDVEALYCVGYEDAKKTIKRCYDALKPGGWLYSQTFKFTQDLFNGCIDMHNGCAMYESHTGPLVGLGKSRPTSRNDIKDLYINVFGNANVTKLKRITDAGVDIQEWVITCQKQ
jgi:SAM-dependent methyltransferase